MDAGTGEMTFGDPIDNKELNRADYAKKLGFDPLNMFCKQPRRIPISQKSLVPITNSANILTLPL